MNSLNIGIFGCKSTTAYIIESLENRVHFGHLITISKELGQKNQVADYYDLVEICKEKGISLYNARDYSLKHVDDVETINNIRLDIAFVIGWQRLLPKDVLKGIRIGAFGMHGSTDDLPKGRGRSPLNWALIEKRNHFRTNLFKYDEGVDSGMILDSFAFSINPYDTAETLHYKNALAMKKLIEDNIDRLQSGNFVLKPQKDLTPTYYPKRSPEDSIIDWESSIVDLEAFVRAVTRPFNGAYSFVGRNKIIIYRCSILELDIVDYGYNESMPGEILDVFLNGKFLVKAKGGILIVHEYFSQNLITKGMIMTSPRDEIKIFDRNPWGYFDL